MPKTATPRKPETVSSKLAETRAKSKNRSLSSLLGIGDNEKRLATDLGSGLNDVIGRGTIAGLLGLPGDLGGAAENGLRSLLGLPQVVPYGGSEHIGQKMEQAGLVSDVRRPKTELLASLISPAQAATAGYKVPQMARAGVKVLDNLSAPRTMGRQQGAIENLWHGSPHTFDRFDLSKIGTGEGAQAYGHGAYLAESPDVASEYQTRLSKGYLVDGQPIDVDQNMRVMLDDIARGGRVDDWINLSAKEMNEPDLVRASELAKTLVGKKISEQSGIGGNLYQTRLAWPDAREATDPLSPDHFLHWDKPLSEQSEFVRNTILESDLAKKVAAEQGIQDLNYIGARHFESPENSAGLRDLGIPGIRYLDGGSRGAGAGSHNYVVFDDKLIDIVSRNGQPVGNLGKMVAPQDEALRVAQGGDSATLSGMGNTLKPTRSEIIARAKAIGISPVGKNDEILSKLSILERDPSTWSVDDFSKVADELDIHQDFRGASQDPEALNSILSEGLRSGMSDNLGHMYSKKFYTYGKGLSGGRSFIFPSRSIKYVSDSNPRFAPGNKPLFYMDATEGQDIYEAFKTAKRNPNYKP